MADTIVHGLFDDEAQSDKSEVAEGQGAPVEAEENEEEVVLPDEVKEICMTIPVHHIESVNKLVQCAWRYTKQKSLLGKMQTRRVMAMVLTPEARKAMANYFEILEKVMPKAGLPQASYERLDVTYGFYLSHKTFKKRDNDNMVKIFQDCLSHHLGFNDNKIITVHTYKRCLNKKTRVSDNEYIYIKIKNKYKEDEELTVEEEDVLKTVGITIS